ncbi:MAG TPA: dockerin type I repeat-containing protein, partial [Thermoanaerobaculia bacterium]|nr:dockerin type I repeat-containing protein [Thermoanaerobaculia bacterium]
LVVVFGDMNDDGHLDAVDLMILSSYLVANISPGQGSFTAPLARGDVNFDEVIDSLDLTIISHYLVENIPCITDFLPEEED